MIQQVYITVTQDDINHGLRGESCQCPIALAIRRAHPSCHAIEVCEYFICFREGNFRWFTNLLPVGVVEFIEGFDAGGPVGPLEFQITFFQQDSLQPAVFGNFDLT